MNRIVVPFALALIGWSPAPAHAATETASAGAVTATLSYTVNKKGTVGDLHVRVTRSGIVLVDEPLQCGLLRIRGCDQLRPSGFVRDDRVISARNVDTDPEPEMLVDLARPSLFSLLYDYDPARGDYVRAEQEWSSHGYELTDLDRDGVPEFEMYDERLTGDACDVPKPPQIFSYRAGRFADSTRAFPRLIARQARALWRCLERSTCTSSPRVVSVVYLADMYLLGLEQRAWDRIRALSRAGEFGPPRMARRQMHRLQRLMGETGYARDVQR